MTRVMDNFNSIATTIGAGFFAGILIGWALKKVIKLIAIVVGLFLAGLTYLQHQQIASINWAKVEQTITILANSMTSNFNDNTFAVAANLGIPLTGSLASGFTLGWIKG